MDDSIGRQNSDLLVDESTNPIHLRSYREAKDLFAMETACKGPNTFAQIYRDVLECNREHGGLDRLDEDKRPKHIVLSKKTRKRTSNILNFKKS